MNGERSDVIILFGGASDERRVSVASAQNVATAVARGGALVPVAGRLGDPVSARPARRAPERLHHGLPAPGLAALADPRGRARLGRREGQDLPARVPRRRGRGRHRRSARSSSAGCAFTGSGSEASANGFDKEKAKALAAKAGVRTVESRELTGDEAEIRSALEEMLARHGRVVAKPVRGGSSVGLFHVKGAGGRGARGEGDRRAAAEGRVPRRGLHPGHRAHRRGGRLARRQDARAAVLGGAARSGPRLRLRGEVPRQGHDGDHSGRGPAGRLRRRAGARGRRAPGARVRGLHAHGHHRRRARARCTSRRTPSPG